MLAKLYVAHITNYLLHQLQTLVDCLLKQTGTVSSNDTEERVMVLSSFDFLYTY